MARKLRVEYPGALYHVMSRGDHGDPIFQDDRDRERFVETLGEAALKTGWQVHAYCLMSNHFHLVVETPQGNLVAGMKWLLGTYTGRFNRRHKLFGHLFSGRYKSLVVDGSGTGYLKTVCDYVHLNPVRAKLMGPEQKLRAYRWSSCRAYLGRRGGGRGGCGWTGCWGSTGCPKTAQRGGGISPRRWKREGRVKISASSKRCGGVGVWGTKRFGRNCWRKWGSGGEPIISEKNVTNRTWRKRNGSSPTNCGGGAGAKRNCASGPRETRGKWSWRGGCGGRRR